MVDGWIRIQPGRVERRQGAHGRVTPVARLEARGRRGTSYARVGGRAPAEGQKRTASESPRRGPSFPRECGFKRSPVGPCHAGACGTVYQRRSGVIVSWPERLECVGSWRTRCGEGRSISATRPPGCGPSLVRHRRFLLRARLNCRLAQVPIVGAFEGRKAEARAWGARGAQMGALAFWWLTTVTGKSLARRTA